MKVLSNLRQVVEKGKRRVGRGFGSGKRKTSGKGHKGQRARNRVRGGFEGGQSRLIVRLPFVRGKSFRGVSTPVVALNLKDVEHFYNDGETISLDSLREKGLVTRTEKKAKILGVGEITKKVIVATDLNVSASAKEKITKAGGTINE